MKRKLTMILAGLFLSIGMALAQTSITGTVVSQEDGQPVIGATVRVPGSNTGAVTDVDGKFTISAPQGAELSVSYIGMKTVTVKAANNMKVTLEPDDASLDEVIRATALDKKGLGGDLRIVLLRSIGESFVHRLPRAEFAALCRASLAPEGAR